MGKKGNRIKRLRPHTFGSSMPRVKRTINGKCSKKIQPEHLSNVLAPTAINKLCRRTAGCCKLSGTEPLSFYIYVHCVSKNGHPFCFCYNSVSRDQILVFFGSLVAKEICNRPLLSYLKVIIVKTTASSYPSHRWRYLCFPIRQRAIAGRNTQRISAATILCIRGLEVCLRLSR